ncbi:hypothetical protein D3C85_1442130 [compost metagenome]
MANASSPTRSHSLRESAGTLGALSWRSMLPTSVTPCGSRPQVACAAMPSTMTSKGAGMRL